MQKIKNFNKFIISEMNSQENDALFIEYIKNIPLKFKNYEYISIQK